MKFADLLKFTATGTSAATITVSAGIAGFRTLAQAIADGALLINDAGIPFTISDSAGNKETSLFAVASGTVLTRTQVLYSSAGGTTPATFNGSTLTVVNSMPASFASQLVTPAALSGSYAVGQVLTAAYPSGTVGTIQFTRTLPTTPFTKTLISGAVASAVNSLTYTVTTADAGFNIGVDCSNQVSTVNGGLVPATVQKATINIAPSQLTTVSGAPAMGTDFDGAPVLRLPNASNEIAFIADTAEVGQKYDVYMLWSLSAAPTSPSPAFVVLAGTYTAWASGSSPSGVTKFFGLVPPQAAGVIERSQLPFSFTREDAGRIARLRYGRRSDTGVGGLVQIRGFELVPTPSIVEASITQGAALTPTSFNTPYATTKVISLLSLYTPIWTTANAVYVVVPVTVGGVQQSRLAKLNKNTYEMIQDVQLTSVGTHDGVIGHRDGSVCVTDDGKVIAYGEAHHSPWKGVAAPTEDISALALTSVPVGLDLHCSYRRFFRNPFDGSMWMGVRGNNYVAGVYKWNGTTFDRKPTSTLIAGDVGGFQGSYGMEIVFTDANTLYVTIEFRQGTDSSTMSGYPRQNISVIKSTDGGATFTTMRGKALNLPIIAGSDDSDIAFPNNNLDHNSSVGRLAVGADGQPILVASWKHPEEPRRSLWVAKYNATTNKWVRTRLLAQNGSIDAGTPHIAHHNGKVIVTAATTDDNIVTGNNNQMYIFTTTDSGATWKQYAITHPVGAYSGAYIDPASLRLDNKLRLLPDFEAQPNSVVWELPVPA
jgi:hypothetical protein